MALEMWRHLWCDSVHCVIKWKTEIEQIDSMTCGKILACNSQIRTPFLLISWWLQTYKHKSLLHIYTALLLWIMGSVTACSWDRDIFGKQLFFNLLWNQPVDMNSLSIKGLCGLLRSVFWYDFSCCRSVEEAVLIIVHSCLGGSVAIGDNLNLGMKIPCIFLRKKVWKVI